MAEYAAIFKHYPTLLNFGYFLPSFIYSCLDLSLFLYIYVFTYMHIPLVFWVLAGYIFLTLQMLLKLSDFD